MNLFKRILKAKRKNDRKDVQLPVLAKTSSGGEERFWTDDLSESGLRMTVFSTYQLVGANRDTELRIVFKEYEEPVRVISEPIWTKRLEDGRMSSGWMFVRFLGDNEQRLADYINAYEKLDSEQRAFWRERGAVRVYLRCPVLVKNNKGEIERFHTDDLSSSGLRMAVSSISELIGEEKDAEIGIVINDEEDPVWLIAESVWSARLEDGRHSSGWRFRSFQDDGGERVQEFVQKVDELEGNA